MPANRHYPYLTDKGLATACSVAMLVAGTLGHANAIASAETTTASTNPIASAETKSNTNATTNSTAATNIAAASATSATSAQEDLTGQLRDLGDTLGRIAHAIIQLQGDYNHRGADIDDLMMDPVSSGNPGLLPSELEGGRILPPKQKWVAYSVNELTKLTGMLNTDLVNISQHKFSSDKLKVQIDVLNDTRLELSADVQKLVSLTENNLNDRAGVLKLCQALRDDASGMNEIRKRLLRLTKGN